MSIDHLLHRLRCQPGFIEIDCEDIDLTLVSEYVKGEKVEYSAPSLPSHQHCKNSYKDELIDLKRCASRGLERPLHAEQTNLIAVISIPVPINHTSYHWYKEDERVTGRFQYQGTREPTKS
ncbi:hypothetical protein V9K67_20865 [Paraflavisolibacter sp. H34]|uniref:hypothetical protein n=1 Tax=Huijunlia imazamoxiresistens TaxID=3127457 RepID=UPI0030180C91